MARVLEKYLYSNTTDEPYYIGFYTDYDTSPIYQAVEYIYYDGKDIYYDGKENTKKDKGEEKSKKEDVSYGDNEIIRD